MRHIIPLLPLLLLVTACDRDPQQLGDREYWGATSSSATVRVVAEDPSLRQQLPGHSAILSRSADLSDRALQVEKAREESPEKVGQPLTTPEELATDPLAASTSVDAQVIALEEDIKKEQEKGFWDHVLEWSGWATVGAMSVYVARLLGIPGVGYLTDPLVKKVGGKWINPILEKEAEAEETIRDLTATVEGSMVGRYALKKLDEALKKLDESLGDQVKETIKDMTKGEETIEGLFKWAAKSHVVDNPDTDSNSVQEVVDFVKDKLATTGLVPDALLKILG